MKQLKHTPGEWRPADIGDWKYVSIGEKQSPSVCKVYGSNDETLEANARLIACCPEMLEALIELISIVKIHSEATKNNFAWAEVDYAKEIIGKATGMKIEEIIE